MKREREREGGHDKKSTEWDRGASSATFFAPSHVQISRTTNLIKLYFEDCCFLKLKKMCFFFCHKSIKFLVPTIVSNTARNRPKIRPQSPEQQKKKIVLYRLIKRTWPSNSPNTGAHSLSCRLRQVVSALVGFPSGKERN